MVIIRSAASAMVLIPETNTMFHNHTVGASNVWQWYMVMVSGMQNKHGQWSINAEKICKARHRIRRNQTFPIWEETLIQFSSLYLGMLWTHNFLKLEIYHQYLCNEDADRVFHFQHIRTQGTDCWWCSTRLSVPAGAFKCNHVQLYNTLDLQM